MGELSDGYFVKLSLGKSRCSYFADSLASEIIGASLSEPQGVMMSTALTCVPVPAYVSARPAWERVKSVARLGTSAVWDLMGG